MTFRSLPLLCSAAVAAAVLVSFAQAPSLTLLSRDGRRQLPLAISGEQELVALDDLAAAFQLAVHEEALGALTVSYKGKTVVLTADQSLASVAGRMISLPAPPSRSGRRWLVPVEFISRALAPIYDVRLELRKPSRLVIVGDLRVPRINVRYEPLGTTGRVTIDAAPRATSTVTQEGERLLVRFDADALDVSNPPLPPQPPQSLVQSVRSVDPNTLIVDLGSRAASFRATGQSTDTTLRQVIDIVPAQTETQAPTPTQPAAPPPELPPALGAATPAIRTIAIDAGHGGDDSGATGANGTKEKDLTIVVARRVKAAIEGRLGIRVLLTRDDDRTVPIDDRAALANNNKADLFISLHANASMRRSAAGATIFSAAFDPDAAKLAAASGKERLPAFGGGLRDIELVPWDLAQTRHLDQSTALAGIIEQQFRDRVPLSNHPQEHAPLRVLESANMPAVLIEIGYLSNPDQEKQLASDAFQSVLVQALYDSVVRFRDALGAGGTR